MIGLFIIFFALWLLFNGRFTFDSGMLQVCIVGLLVSGFAYFLSYRFLGITPKKELWLLKKLPLLVLYALVLVKEIVLANLQMIKIILDGKHKNKPVMVQVRIPLKTELCRVIFANSVTLTPGTITADFEGDMFVIHCIDEKLSEGIEGCSFVKILERLEK